MDVTVGIAPSVSVVEATPYYFHCNFVFGRPFVKRFALRYRTVAVCLSVCNIGVLWPNGWMDQDATWYGGRQHCVRWGPSPLPQKGTARNFRPMTVLAKRLDGSRCQLVRR